MQITYGFLRRNPDDQHYRTGGTSSDCRPRYEHRRFERQTRGRYQVVEWKQQPHTTGRIRGGQCDQCRTSPRCGVAIRLSSPRVIHDIAAQLAAAPDQKAQSRLRDQSSDCSIYCPTHKRLIMADPLSIDPLAPFQSSRFFLLQPAPHPMTQPSQQTGFSRPCHPAYKRNRAD